MSFQDRHLENFKMQQITINAFEFKELKPEIQKKVLDKHREINIHDEWWDCSLEGLVETTKDRLKLDIKRDKVFFEFGGKTSYAKIDIGELSRALSEKYPKLINIDLPSFFGVSAYWTLRKSDFGNKEIIELEEEFAEDESIEKEIEIVINEEIKESIIKDLNELQDILADFLKGLFEDESYLYSDEAIIETLEANEYMFDENGKVV